jgi:hypothetical protein
MALQLTKLHSRVHQVAAALASANASKRACANSNRGAATTVARTAAYNRFSIEQFKYDEGYLRSKAQPAFRAMWAAKLRTL